jgi:hypothetical protein
VRACAFASVFWCQVIGTDISMVVGGGVWMVGVEPFAGGREGWCQQYVGGIQLRKGACGRHVHVRQRSGWCPSHDHEIARANGLLAPVRSALCPCCLCHPLPFSQHYLANDQKLKRFVPLIKDSLVYPAIYDADRTLLSLPPIINGAATAVSEA